MTKKEIINEIKPILEELSYPSAVAYLTLNDKKWLKATIKALEQEPYDFARWVAREIFDENWEYNKDANFAEIACRKLEKLGIVRAKGDEWELVESEGEG